MPVTVDRGDRGLRSWRASEDELHFDVARWLEQQRFRLFAILGTNGDDVASRGDRDFAERGSSDVLAVDQHMAPDVRVDRQP